MVWSSVHKYSVIWFLFIRSSGFGLMTLTQLDLQPEGKIVKLSMFKIIVNNNQVLATALINFIKFRVISF